MKGMAVEPEAFRDFFGSVPTAVAVVTTVGADGRPLGFTCNAFSAVSLDPALLLVCVDERSRTLPALLGSEVFALHLLAAEGGEELARTFAGRSDRKFDGLAWRHGESVPGSPVLREGVLAHAECALESSVRAGDHRLLIGRMERVLVREEARPLLYRRGAFTAWEAPVAETAVEAVTARVGARA
ncbi:hypothetical protein GCM10010272_09270 [Streptomyces lateritius]|nr:flavin reductase family protein [Streptomyces sp.]GGT68488.1 hypothetical protein GCM10010272_09270 [Streptomyces lateritius]